MTCNCIGGNPCPCRRGAELGSWNGINFIQSDHLAALGVDLAVQNGDRTYLCIAGEGRPMRIMEVRFKPNGELDLAWYENHHGQMGSAHFVSGQEAEVDRAEQLRRVVEEITGEAVGTPAKRRIGFL